jgi:hypothetical protein
LLDENRPKADMVAANAVAELIAQLAKRRDPQDKTPAEYPIASANKEITVAVTCRFTTAPLDQDLLPADSELADLLVQRLNKRSQENREKVKWLSPVGLRPSGEIEWLELCQGRQTLQGRLRHRHGDQHAFAVPARILQDALSGKCRDHGLPVRHQQAQRAKQGLE